MSDLLQTIKDQVSNEKWPANFDDLHIKYREELWPEVCKRYAFEVAKASLKEAKKRIEELEAELKISKETERRKCIQEIRSEIRPNCEDHTPFRGACMSCGEYSNYNVLPMPESLIAILERPLNPSTNGKQD
jgi:hypothetical protein